jgi:hypothetical protein
LADTRASSRLANETDARSVIDPCHKENLMKLDKPLLYALGSLLVGGTALAAVVTNGNPASGSLTGPHTAVQVKLFGEILAETEDEAEDGFSDEEWNELCTILANSGLSGTIHVRGKSKTFGKQPKAGTNETL